ncbi:hypothetical protein EDC96DRAFT_567762 [Choanephora cucurbitarum]|nr:hypothetical protein EDC96DRAFT_567762 [Choanephora cucurbitarum]
MTLFSKVVLRHRKSLVCLPLLLSKVFLRKSSMEFEKLIYDTVNVLSTTLKSFEMNQPLKPFVLNQSIVLMTSTDSIADSIFSEFVSDSHLSFFIDFFTNILGCFSEDLARSFSRAVGLNEQFVDLMNMERYV